MSFPPPDAVEVDRWYARIIATTCSSYADCVYVEIGVGQGFSIQEVAPVCAEVHGVDRGKLPQRFMPEGARFWHMPSDQFFSVYDGSAPHVVFVDGDHSYEQAKRDVENALSLLAEGGIVFLHDTWPREEQDTIPERCGTVWKLAVELERSADLESFTWPRFPGLTAVRRRGEGIERSTLRA